MKLYKKQIKLGNPAQNIVPVLPEFSTGDPKAGEFTAFVYDNQGHYMGWAPFEVIQKYLYAKLYYKTKGRYSIDSSKEHDNRKFKNIRLKEKLTGCTALFIKTKTLDVSDLVDDADTGSKAQYCLDHELKPLVISKYNYANFADKFGYLEKFKKQMGDQIREIEREEELRKQAIFTNTKAAMEKHVEDLIAGEALLKKSGEETGWDLSKL